MEARKLAGTILSVSCKTLLFVLVVFLLIFVGRGLYNFGQKIFREEALTTAEYAYSKEITIPEGKSVMDVAEILEEEGMIEDSKLFFVQVLLSDYYKKFVPGTYTISTDMKPTEIMVTISPEPETTEE